MFRLACMLAGLGIVAGIPAWGGREFPTGKGETVVPNEFIVQLAPNVDAGVFLSQNVPNGLLKNLNKFNLHLLKLPGGASARFGADMAAQPGVLYIEANRIRETNITPDDTSFASQWALQTIQAAKAWTMMPGRFLTSGTAGTTRIKVAILDTGIDCTHPD